MRWGAIIVACALAAPACDRGGGAPAGDPAAPAQGEAYQGAAGEAAPEDLSGIPDEQDERRISLLFPAADGETLVPEGRVIFLTNTQTSQIKQAVSELLLGPQGDGKVAPFPPSTPLRAVFLMPDGTAVIDLGREAREIPGGSTSEAAAVYALVDTVAVNFPDVRRVQILIEGEETPTLTGHLDTSRPLAPDLRRIEWGAAGPPASVTAAVPAEPPG